MNLYKIELIICMKDRTWYTTIVDLSKSEYENANRNEIAIQKMKDTFEKTRNALVAHVGFYSDISEIDPD